MDLNLVRVFVAVYESRSLTVAARRLYVTQPAVSQSLGRLRRELDDPLFHRDGKRMRPTPLADELYPGFQEAVAGIDRTLDAARRFDPTDTTRLFRIALSELGEIGWFPAILAAVRSVAPRVRVEVVALDPTALPEWLARGTVDLAVTAESIPGGFERVRVKTQRYAATMSAANPLAERELDLDAYALAAHVRVAGDSGRSVVEAAQRRAGLEITPAVAVRHFATLPPVLAADRSVIATVPDTIAEGWTEAWPLHLAPLPFQMAPVELYLYRRATTQHTAALDWLFDTVNRAIAGSSGRFWVIHGDAHSI